MQWFRSKNLQYLKNMSKIAKRKKEHSINLKKIFKYYLWTELKFYSSTNKFWDKELRYYIFTI